MKDIQAIAEIKTIISSQVLRRLLQRNRIFYQGKINEHVRAQDWNSASAALGKVDYIDKFGSMVQTEYEKLTKEE